MIDQSTLKYIFVGGTSSIVFLGLLAFQVEFFLIDPVVATVISNLILIFATYPVLSKWVFISVTNHKVAFIKYASVIALGFTINTLGMYLFVHILEFWYLLSQVILFVVVAVNNYSLNKLWTFK
tara:strand:+ start:8609 stop:8980 length:372 start_codon:yes stop_codon:yes gene_type:complete